MTKQRLPVYLMCLSLCLALVACAVPTATPAPPAATPEAVQPTPVVATAMPLPAATATALPEPTAPAAPSTAVEVADAFYTWYLDYTGSPGSGNLQNPLVDGAYRDSGYLTPEFVKRVDDLLAGFSQGGYDPFLQAQDIPQGFTVEPGPTPETALVHLQFGPGSTQDLLVVTVDQNGTRLIDDVRSIRQGPQEAAPAPATGIEGRWEGTLDVAGAQLQIAVDFSAASGETTATIDIPAQGAAGLNLHDVSYQPPAVHFEMLDGARLAVFDGEMKPDGSISGTFSQADVEGTFDLSRSQQATATATAEPLPYAAEDVSFENGDVTLAGTLTLPEGPGPHPALILISGSGQQNRNEEIPTVPGYQPFKVIADHLTRNGIAVLRYDDRGMGQSTGDPSQDTSADFATDTEAALDYLLQRPEINPEQIGLLGHSEGGLIAAMVAARRPEVAFVISMSGTAVSGYDLLLKQIERISSAAGATPEEAAQAVEQQKTLLDMAKAQDWQGAEDYLTGVLEEQIKALPADQQAALGGDPKTVARERAKPQIQAIQLPWYQFFINYDPGQDWEKVTVPVLALFGDKDVQVDVEQNRAALEAALEKAGNQDVSVVVFPTANHLYQDAVTGSPNEYATLPTTFVPGFLDTITQWLLERVTVPAGS